MKKGLAVYWAAAALHVAGWAVYYSVSRSLGDKLGTQLLLLLVVLETAPSILSILSSSIAARRGYRGLLLLGFVEATGLAGFGLLPYPWFFGALLVASLGWALAGPHTITVMLESGYRGMELGAALSSTAVGWTLGSFAGPLLREAMGLSGSMLIAASMVASCYALILGRLPGRASRPGGSRVGWRETLAYSLALSPLIVATETSFTLIMSRLSSELPTLHYSLVLGATGVTSALGKLAAGSAVRRVRPSLVYRGAMLGYAAWMLISSRLDGYALAAAFVTPIYPFFEIGFYEHVSPLLGERRATAAWAASYTLASLGVLVLAYLHPGFTEALTASSALALLGLVATNAVERRIGGRAAREAGVSS